jgi:hypothetical protein
MRKQLLFLLIFLLTGCSKQIGLDQSVSYEALSLFKYFPKVKESAKNWDPGAVTVMISIDVITPSTTLQTAYIDINFESRGKLGETISFKCSKMGCESEVFKINYSLLDTIELLDPLDLEGVALDSGAVITIAQQYGANYYLTKEGADCTLNLTWFENKLVWFGHFQTRNDNMSIYIDPVSGDVLKINDTRE